ncbi:MarR family winged helix-turn-helix transcriptional regulator [Blautia marasmi]|uniref:MarR family winged helix-turn-helix transcriptional regulator n=1 Tax=Blautia marasmi TaxID=1917868 RepID=UPI000CF259D5|nr:MarR family transcriptional regulator [Blautia marasmi]
MQKEKDENVMRLLKKLNLAMESIGNAMMVKHGMSASQCNVLGYLTDHEEQDICARDLHISLGLSKANVSSLLKKLKNGGYISFASDSLDERLKHIHLTKKADELKGEIEQGFRDLEGCMYQGFTEGEKLLLTELLGRMLKNLKQQGTGGLQHD